MQIYGVNKKIIQECTHNLTPRNGRYTIVDKYFNKVTYVDEILEKFYRKEIV